MELKCIEDYSAAPDVFLKVGDTTAGRDISEDSKAAMLKDYPEKFEVIKTAKPVTETPPTPEVKADKKGK